MENDKIKKLIEIRNVETINAYLELGWAVVEHFVSSYPIGRGQVDQVAVYHLGWFADGSPKYPVSYSELDF